jgi:hypothetical protein
MTFLAVGAFAVAQSPGMRRSHVTVESPARHSDTTLAPKRTTTSRPRPATPTTSPATLPASTNPPPGTTSGSGVAVLPGTSGTSASNSAPTTGAASSAPAATQPPRSAVAPQAVHQYNSAGGSIVVRLNAGTLTLLQVSPDQGNHANVHAQPTTIDVWFLRKDRAISRIQVTVVNGHMYGRPDNRPSTDQPPGKWSSTKRTSSGPVGSGTAHALAAVRAVRSIARRGRASASSARTRHPHQKNHHSAHHAASGKA